jgi:glycosyltransferase involved in cell wall biosynthesis
MKIVQVQTQATAAGAQRISDMVGEGLRGRGHQVRTVFMYRLSDAYDADPYADFLLDHTPRSGFEQLRAVVALVGYMRRERPDAVLTFQHYGNLFGAVAARLAGVRKIIANQSGAPHQGGLLGFLAKIDRIMGSTGFYDVNVVNSAWTAEQFAAYPRAYRRRLRRIDHGVPQGAAGLSKAAARARFGLPSSAPLIVSTGRITRRKNQTVLLAALARLPEAHLAIAGIGAAESELRQAAEARGVSGRLHLVGELMPERIQSFLAAGDVFAFPSLTETFGLSAVEAATVGLPIVASDLAVLREVLADGEREAALFVDATDPPAFAEAIARLLADAELAARLSEAGLDLARRYSPEAMCAGYDAILGERPAPAPGRSAPAY